MIKIGERMPCLPELEATKGHSLPAPIVPRRPKRWPPGFRGAQSSAARWLRASKAVAAPAAARARTLRPHMPRRVSVLGFDLTIKRLLFSTCPPPPWHSAAAVVHAPLHVRPPGQPIECTAARRHLRSRTRRRARAPWQRRRSPLVAPRCAR